MSATFIDEAISERRSDPTAGTSVLVAVGLEPDAADVEGRLESLGASIEAELPYDTYRISIPETSLDDLCELDMLESVELEREFRVHEGN